jgi:transcriptional regulator with XRE-family HTH domain
MKSRMELVQPLEAVGGESRLARARLHRQLTLEETARRAGISVEQARWLEEGRVYRFPSPDDALLTALLYGSALGIDNREARELAGLPVPAAPVERNLLPRLIVPGAILIALALLTALVLIPHAGKGGKKAQTAAILPPPWRVDVNVLNGSGDISYTRQVASRVQALGYTIKHVGPADSFSYPQTAVYFPPKCENLALRLAKQLGVTSKPLPGGTGPCKLWVIAGPARGPGE